MSDPTLLQELIALSDPSPDRIGGKGAGLLQLYGLGLQVPPAWVIPTETFTHFVSSLNLGPQLEELEEALGLEPPREKLERVREVILAAPLPENLLTQVHELRRQWAEEFGGRIIVRSSATVEDNERRSFAGIFESIPCHSDQEVENAIRRVWASVFSPRAFAYYGIASLKRFPAMALILQPFVEAHRSGVMFTRYAGPDQQPQILVEHVAGSGDKLVTGQVNPDRFWMQRWPTGDEGVPGATGMLAPRFALELAQVAQKLELKLERPQDVEWCVRDEQLYILQTRPITAGGEAASMASMGEVLLQGVGASPGRAGGAVHLVFNIEDADVLRAGQVLTTTMTNPDMVPSMQRSAAVVTDVGGMICHAAIVSRELGIPCVVGTKSATQTLQAGSLVTVDGNTGVIFLGLVESQGDTLPARKLEWSDLWQEWQVTVSAGTIPLISTYRALANIPQGIGRCVYDPLCDLSLDSRAEISPLTSLEETTRNELLRSYVERLTAAVSQTGVQAVFLDLHRLDPETQSRLRAFLYPGSPVHPLQYQSIQGPWQIQVAPDGQQFALLDQLTPEALEAAPRDAILAIPLGFGRLLRGGPIQLPQAATQGPEGMFGMMPEVRMARMPARERREAMHRLIPTLSQAHGGQVPVSDQEFPWLDLRPEVLITPFLKAFVTPGVEAIPFVLGFDDPPLHIQFIRCRFHFRQDTLFGSFPKLMQATWDEGFLSNMLQRCRASYEKLERLSESLPADEEALRQAGNEALRGHFVAWWNAFCEFFSLSFFIQAQGDDCVFPVLGMMAEGNAALLENNRPDWRIPGLAQLSAPVTPVLTAEYMQDLLALKQELSAQGLENLAAAQQAIGSADMPALNAIFAQVRDRWHWMRERDPYYDPYDTPAAILEKALSIRSADPPDYETNRAQAELALALHFDLARVMGTSEKLVYAVKYGRALAIDRENHHIVWLRASYRLRKLLLEWERQLGEHSDLKRRDIFFLQPWEILDAIAALPQPIPAELLARLRNRRLAYEREIQLKTGRESSLTPQLEEDYY